MVSLPDEPFTADGSRDTTRGGERVSSLESAAAASKRQMSRSRPRARPEEISSSLPLVLPARQAACKEMAVRMKRCPFQQLGCSSGATDSMQVNASSRAATAGARAGGSGLHVSMSHCPPCKISSLSSRQGPLAFWPGISTKYHLFESKGR